MGMQLELIPAGTRVESNGEGAKFDVAASATRTFLCLLNISDQIEQESLDVSIRGSDDGETWGAKPLLKLPQRFYRGSTKMILDLTLRPSVKFIRAKWELNRWGRVAPLPMFEIGLKLEEIPAMARNTSGSRVAAGS